MYVCMWRSQLWDPLPVFEQEVEEASVWLGYGAESVCPSHMYRSTTSITRMIANVCLYNFWSIETDEDGLYTGKPTSTIVFKYLPKATCYTWRFMQLQEKIFI